MKIKDKKIARYIKVKLKEKMHMMVVLFKSYSVWHLLHF